MKKMGLLIFLPLGATEISDLPVTSNTALQHSVSNESTSSRSCVSPAPYVPLAATKTVGPRTVTINGETVKISHHAYLPAHLALRTPTPNHIEAQAETITHEEPDIMY